MLKICNAQSICNYLAAPNGKVTIYNNAPGCNTPPEIAEDCDITLSCLPFGDYYFTSQSNIDNFSYDYSNCTELAGEVLIRGDNINNLNGLNDVTLVNGSLTIDGYLNNNLNLKTLEGLNNLTKVNGDLIIKFNDSLVSLQGLNSLDTVGGKLSIRSCYLLDSITSLKSLRKVGGDFFIHANNNLKSLKGLDSLKTVSGNLKIIFDTKIETLEGLGNLDSLYGLTVAQDALKNLTGLENLTSLSGNLCIGESNYGGNPYLTSLSGLENIKAIGALEIYLNDSLTDLSGLRSLKTIGGDAYIHHNERLSNLNGLELLDTVYRTLNLSYIPLTGGVSALQNIKYIGGSLYFDNSLVPDFTGFKNLNTIENELYISHCSKTIDFSGFENLTSIGGNVYIMSNSNLHQVTSLKNLNSIGGNLQITGNSSLSSLSGLDNIEPGSISNLYISVNPMLSTCEVESICLYLADPNGEVVINNNDEGCNSIEEVENACSIVHVPETKNPKAGDDVIIYPNPAGTIIHIGNSNSVQAMDVRLFNSTGQCLIHKSKIRKLNVSSLTTGLYFLQLKTSKSVVVKKVLIVR